MRSSFLNTDKWLSDDLILISLQNEGYTIGELLRTYIYKYNTESIRLINYDPGYPTEKGIILNIIHPTYEKTILDSIDYIINDIKLFNTNLLKLI